ncbi:UNVERIFIED_CONTAM: zinc ribbon family protein [Acetivibrio alkalicellulosi]
MFIIFGWGRQTVKEHGPVYRYQCEHCRNDEYWQLYTRKTWFTLFFIPVIPYRTEHLMLCPVCSRGVVLDEAKFDEFRQIAECNVDLLNGKITQEEHGEKIRLLGSIYVSQQDEDPSFAAKTETQKNYIKQMQELEKEK